MGVQVATYLGNFEEDATVKFGFVTSAADIGRESFNNALEEGDIVIYKDGAVMTLDASTISITENPGSAVGVYLIEVDMSNDTDFTTGSDYLAYLYPDTETVDSQNVAGALAQWSCENRVINVTKIEGSDATDQINAAVDAALDTAIAELSSVPSATPTLREALMLLFMALRNKVDVPTSGTDVLEIHNDAGTVIGTKTISDDGSDYSESKMS